MINRDDLAKLPRLPALYERMWLTRGRIEDICVMCKAGYSHMDIADYYMGPPADNSRRARGRPLKGISKVQVVTLNELFGKVTAPEAAEVSGVNINQVRGIFAYLEAVAKASEGDTVTTELEEEEGDE